MMNRLAAFGWLSFAIAMFAGLPAQAGSNIFPAEATIPNSRIITFTSVIDKEPYTLQVGIPLLPPPKGGYSVIYLLDGEMYFLEAVFASGPNTVVVGIGHNALNDKDVVARYANLTKGKPTVLDGQAALDAFSFLRDHDFRWPAKAEHRAPSALIEAMGPDRDNDVDSFLLVIEKEIKPKVQALVPIDRANQALFGHSAGGLAVVRALFTEPLAFRSFIAASPRFGTTADRYSAAKNISPS